MDFVGGTIGFQAMLVEELGVIGKSVSRVLGPAGAALTQLGADRERDDLNTRQRWTRVAVQAGVAGASDAFGAYVGARFLVVPVAGPALAIGAGALSAGGASIVANGVIDVATDNIPGAEWLLGDWL
jgi:hypothetical protein